EEEVVDEGYSHDVRIDARSRVDGRTAECHRSGREPVRSFERGKLLFGIGVPPREIQEVRKLACEWFTRRRESGNVNDGLLSVAAAGALDELGTDMPVNSDVPSEQVDLDETIKLSDMHHPQFALRDATR